LKQFCKDKHWIVENVKSYYPTILNPIIIERHQIWSNIEIPIIELPKRDIGTFNRSASKEAQKRSKKTQAQRNCVNEILGLHVLNCIKEDQDE